MLHTINDTCKLLSIGRTTVYRLIDDGHLERVKIGQRTLVTHDSICALIDSARQVG